jgi:hypothetical protein
MREEAEYRLEFNSKIYKDFNELNEELQPIIRMKSATEVIEAIDALSKDDDVSVTVALFLDETVINAATLEQNRGESYSLQTQYCEDYNKTNFFESSEFSLKSLIPKSLIAHNNIRGTYVFS